MTELVEFLRARLDEDERVARQALEWWDSDREAGYFEWPSQEASWHIARHDPARELREVAAKRRIISEYERYAAERRRAMNGWDTSEPSPIITALASVYVGHPDYQQEWNLNLA